MSVTTGVSESDCWRAGIIITDNTSVVPQLHFLLLGDVDGDDTVHGVANDDEDDA